MIGEVAAGGVLVDHRRRRDRPVPSVNAALADEAIEIVWADPSRAGVLANEALTGAVAAGDVQAESKAAHALGLVAYEQNDLAGSMTSLTRAIDVAGRAALDVEEAEARRSLMGTLVNLGDLRGALRQADLAAPALQGLGLARLEAHRASVLVHDGRLDEAAESFRKALPVLRRKDDLLWQALVYSNRSFLHFRRGDLAAAEADLRRAERLHVTLGLHRYATNDRQHLAILAARRGDIPRALVLFDEADAYFADRGEDDSIGMYDRCESLLAARLAAEARHTAAKAIASLEHEGRLGYVAEVRLMLAEAALLEGDGPTARKAADEARTAFASQGRPTYVALARHVGCRAAWLEGDRSPALLVAARKAAVALTRAGFAVPAADARLLTAEIALELGRPRIARRELACAGRARSSGPVGLRSRAWHAEAMLRLADGNRSGADAALRAGVHLLDRHRASLGATDLRAYASAHGQELARLGLRLALEGGRAERVLAWAERWRARALRLRPARPPEDARLAADLTALRGVVAEVEQAALGGRPTQRLLSRQATLERAVRDRARHAPGDGTLLDLPVSYRQLAAALGDDVLVEMMDDGEVLHAVVVRDGRARLRRLAPVAEVDDELDRLRFALRRLAVGVRSDGSRTAFRHAAALGGRRLDELLFGPLTADVADRRLVLVPTGTLHSVPWSVLPSRAGRALTVAPSARVWHRAATARVGPGLNRVVLVAGPGLEHAAAEVRALSRRYPGATTLIGDEATCGAVCAALDGADLAHLAAHGRFRSDNPLFSCVELANGPATVYDLEALREAPQVLVLSACESAMAVVRPGDELMGLSAAVLALGTRALVASVFPVPDEATRPLMLAFHGGLRAGLAPAEALARAQVRLTGGDPVRAAAAAAFVCLGAGHRALVE